jgi:hypothetical protein
MKEKGGGAKVWWFGWEKFFVFTWRW